MRAHLGVVVWLMAMPAFGGQSGESDQVPPSVPPTAETQPTPGGPAPPPPPPGAVVLQADEQEQLEDGHILARGYVTIQRGDVRLQADSVEFWREEMRAVARGNVVFQQGDQKIVGSRMEVNLEDGTGTFYDAHGVAGRDFYFHGDVVERESEDVYVIRRGAFTSCAQPVPRWHFTAGKARIRRDHHAELHNAFLNVKSFPVFYVPLLYYPIDEDDRSTGFLMPQIGNSSFKGFMLSESFFWAINRSMDATITGDYFSEAGVGLGSEYRYMASPSSRGNFMSYFLDDKNSGQREYSLNYSMRQDIPGGFQSNAQVDYFSSFDFQQRYQENYNRATSRSKRATGTLSGSWSNYTLRVLFDRNDTSFSDKIAVRQILPSATMSSRPINLGPTPLLFWFRGEASSFSRTSRDTLVDYRRFDILPSLSYPFAKLSYLTFRTTLSGRYSYYSSQLDDRGAIIEEPIDRRYYEVSFDARGPTLARIFNTPGGFYADRYKHVIEPQVVWSYRTRVETFDQVPKFDSIDYVPGTNQLSFSLVNRFFSKKLPQQPADAPGLTSVEGGAQAPGATPGQGPGGVASASAVPVEFLTWVVSQRYFFDINASLYDPQFSTPYFSEDGIPSRYSPITSKLVFRPNNQLYVSWNLEYDVNFGDLRSQGLISTFSGAWGSLRGMWSKVNLLEREQVRNNLRLLTDLRLSTQIETSFEINYDIEAKNMTQLGAGVNYNVQCCGFFFEASRYQFGKFRDEMLFRFGVTLANVGSFGTFLGGSRQND